MRPLYFPLRHVRRTQRCGITSLQAAFPRAERSGTGKSSLLLPSRETQCPHKRHLFIYACIVKGTLFLPIHVAAEYKDMFFDKVASPPRRAGAVYKVAPERRVWGDGGYSYREKNISLYSATMTDEIHPNICLKTPKRHCYFIFQTNKNIKYKKMYIKYICV